MENIILDQHNARQVRSTRPYVPFKIAFKQEFQDSSEARRVELRLKKLKRKDFIRKVIDNKSIYLRATSSSGRAIDS
jgi:predicted GIY-YIG superfamily endonuclease